VNRPAPAKTSKRPIPPHLLAHAFTKDSPKAAQMGRRGGKVIRSTSKGSRQ
jgi:hypothetical protein